jgi:hypothetical protein
MLKLGDHQFQMRHHGFRTARPGLGFLTCHTLGREFSTQRIDVVRDRIGGSHRNNQGITLARSRARGICRPAPF